ncbi:uncharacterized protein LOC122083914 [Macadamia integrifolia]|uniref:uncharacterized protein LOC122083914 n=1 Tax=Macadamia integrifolia TaxID=60698 RepID=UPI001C4E9EAE|nr:uncharacterized protein LOC122083914 [Macadamia integrifolia]
MASSRSLTVESILILFIICLVFSHNRVEGGKGISRQEEDEDLELERQLKLLNKPAVKSIKTEYGDIYDCVDIKKQPAFDHPLLKNHTIQMKPSSLPKGMINKKSSGIRSSEIGFKNNECPPGTVIIRRTQKEDLTRAKSLVRRSPGNAHRLTKANPGYHLAPVSVQRPDTKYYGANVYFSLYEPKVSANQFSEAVLWVESLFSDKFDSIQVGWTANPKLFGDNRCRLFSYWMSDGFHGKGCYNLLCSGFVQVSRQISFGLTFKNISTYDGPQVEDCWLVFRDPKSGHWWFVLGSTQVGYWPSEIFSDLRTHASSVSSGGEVYGPTNEPSPPMGSGHLPQAFNMRSATLARRFQVVDDKLQLLDPDYNDFKPHPDTPKCYNVLRAFPWGRDIWKNSFLFGGPGGDCGA